MNDTEKSNLIRATLLNNTDKYWSRAELVEGANKFLETFPDSVLLEQSDVERALLGMHAAGVVMINDAACARISLSGMAHALA